MERRSFLRNSLFAGIGSMFIPSLAVAQAKEEFGRKKAKNIIFLVSDGMSIGTMVMADLYSKRRLGRSG